MNRILEHVIPPKLGYALVVKRGQHLRIIDLEGKQVVDMALFTEANPREKLSTCPLDVLNACNGHHGTPVKVEVYAEP